MAEKILKEKDETNVLLFGFYKKGEELDIVSNVDTWDELELSNVLRNRATQQLEVLHEMALREQYEKLSRESK